MLFPAMTVLLLLQMPPTFARVGEATYLEAEHGCSESVSQDLLVLSDDIALLSIQTQKFIQYQSSSPRDRGVFPSASRDLDKLRSSFKEEWRKQMGEAFRGAVGIPLVAFTSRHEICVAESFLANVESAVPGTSIVMAGLDAESSAFCSDMKGEMDHLSLNCLDLSGWIDGIESGPGGIRNSNAGYLSDVYKRIVWAKPLLLLEAAQAGPEQGVVLMDVDIVLHGDLLKYIQTHLLTGTLLAVGCEGESCNIDDARKGQANTGTVWASRTSADLLKRWFETEVSELAADEDTKAGDQKFLAHLRRQDDNASQWLQFIPFEVAHGCGVKGKFPTQLATHYNCVGGKIGSMKKNDDWKPVRDECKDGGKQFLLETSAFKPIDVAGFQADGDRVANSSQAYLTETKALSKDNDSDAKTSATLDVTSNGNRSRTQGTVVLDIQRIMDVSRTTTLANSLCVAAVAVVISATMRFLFMGKSKDETLDVTSTALLCCAYVAIAASCDILVKRETQAHEGHLPFIPLRMVCLVEFLKLCLTLTLVMGRLSRGASILPEKADCLTAARLTLVPAICYSINNAIVYVMISRIDFSSLSVWRQMTPLFVAGIWVISFRCQLGAQRWFSLSLLVTGLILNSFGHGSGVRFDAMVGVVLGSCFITAIAGVANEYVMRRCDAMDIDFLCVLLYVQTSIISFVLAIIMESRAATVLTGMPPTQASSLLGGVGVLEDWPLPTIILLQVLFGFAVARVIRYLGAVPRSVINGMKELTVVMVAPVFIQSHINRMVIMSALVVGSAAAIFTLAPSPLPSIKDPRAWSSESKSQDK
jgi:hypothetical protein